MRKYITVSGQTIDHNYFQQLYNQFAALKDVPHFSTMDEEVRWATEILGGEVSIIDMGEDYIVYHRIDEPSDNLIIIC